MSLFSFLGKKVDLSQTQQEKTHAFFHSLAGQWWDGSGKFAALHAFTPARLAIVKEQLKRHFNLKGEDLSGLRLLDVGCGGGLFAEPLARLGATVVGIDPVAASIKVAQEHAKEEGLSIEYRCGEAADLVAEGLTFDGVIHMEVVEHVAQPARFVAEVASLVKPGGLLVGATLNRDA